MSQKAAIRRRKQAVLGDRHVAPAKRRWAKPTPGRLKSKVPK